MFRPSTPTEPIPQAAWRGSSPVVSVDGEPLFADDLMASIVPETPSSMPPQPLQQPRLLGTPQKQDWQMQSDSLPSTASYSVEAQPALLVPKQHSFYTQRVSNGGVDDSGVGTAQETHAQGDLGMLSDLEVPSTCAMLKQNKLVHEMLALEPLGKSGEEACSNLSLKQGLWCETLMILATHAVRAHTRSSICCSSSSGGQTPAVSATRRLSSAARSSRSTRLYLLHSSQSERATSSPLRHRLISPPQTAWQSRWWTR